MNVILYSLKISIFGYNQMEVCYKPLVKSMILFEAEIIVAIAPVFQEPKIIFSERSAIFTGDSAHMSLCRVLNSCYGC